MTGPARVAERARRWMEGDPDPETRAEMARLLEAGDGEELADRMAGNLAFGTAGLRGAVEAGSNRMNRAVVIRAARGLADFLLERHGGVPPGPVAVGRDARLSSARFMDDAVGVLTAAGLPVRFWENPVATPLVAYSARSLGACAAVVITASHNPPRDNGFKVYDGDGAQIVPPVDAAIAVAMERAGPADRVPMREGLAGAEPIGPGMLEEYRRDLAALRPDGAGDGSLRIVYTPLHGVGWEPVREVLGRAGYREVRPVPEQQEPDGRFPTVDFPNPEEPGALDLALGLAEETGADLLLANDPDADRLAAAVPGDGGWKVLTGNQVGVLLADYVLSHFPPGGAVPLVLNTIVSSPMLGAVAAAHGARCETTFTGFKWIANAALELEEAGGEDDPVRFAFGYEEALGFSVGSVVRDKDGVGAALALADLAAECRQSGTTLLDRLASLYRRFGLWVSAQRSVARAGPAGRAELAGAMEKLGGSPPSELAGRAVREVTDYRSGDGTRPRWRDAAPVIALDLEGGGRTLARPSGTEPKLKIYVDLPGFVPEGADPFRLEERIAAQAGSVADALAAHMGLA